MKHLVGHSLSFQSELAFSRPLVLNWKCVLSGFMELGLAPDLLNLFDILDIKNYVSGLS
jgi:hypothetical protein